MDTSVDNYTQALRALKRQKLAVERTLGARSNEECMVASRWVGAWQKLVQARLDHHPVGPGRYTDSSGRVLH